MNARVVAMLAAVALLGVVAWVTLAPSSPSPGSDYNLLVIVWDTTRADRLGLYGYDKPTTPRLEALAEDAVVFERAISPAIWTPPSHSSLFTGFAPTHHGVKASHRWLDDHHVTLAEWLGEQGYATYAFSANPYVAPITNITQGFDTVDITFKGRWKRAARKATTSKLLPDDASTDISPAWKPKEGQAPGPAASFKDAAPVAHEALVQWLEDERDDPEAPWFAFINMMEPHIPRVPTLASRRAVMNQAQQDLALTTDASQINLLAYIFGKKSYTVDELDAINGVYDAAIRDMDAATGDMFDDLRARGHLDDTIVVLTADHGENLGDHGMFGHKFSIYDTLVHVPLVIWHPDMAARRVEHPVSNLNLFTTILGMLDVGMPPGVEPDGSLDLMSQAGPSPVFTEMIEATPVAVKRIDTLYGLDDKERWLRTFAAITDRDLRLTVASDGTHELFDLEADPGETEDKSEAFPVEVKRLKRALEEWQAGIEAYDPTRAGPGDKRPTLDRKTRKMLEELGYMEDD